MAEIVAGFGSSHGPLLILPSDDWTVRADFDRGHIHDYKGGKYSFDELVKLRNEAGEHFEDVIKPEVRKAHALRCQDAMDRLGEIVCEVNPDVLVMVGDDQEEWFLDAVQPAFSIFCGEAVLNSAYVEEEHTHKHPSVQMVEMHRHAPADTYYPVVKELGEHMIMSLIDDEFDVTASSKVPVRNGAPVGVGHAFSFLVRRILKDDPIPMVPVMLNTYYPPNQPLPGRCFDMGRAIGRAIRSWDSDARVGVIASGGLSHFVIDEAWDRRMLKAMEERDWDTFRNEPDEIFRSGTSETKNWILTLGAISEENFEMELLDYVPCYRSEAGTGNAMAFAAWR